MRGLRIFPKGIGSYLEAKDFLSHGVVILQSSSNVSVYKKYLMPDGKIFGEMESLLESPEDDYVLKEIEK